MNRAPIALVIAAAGLRCIENKPTSPAPITALHVVTCMLRTTTGEPTAFLVSDEVAIGPTYFIFVNEK